MRSASNRAALLLVTFLMLMLLRPEAAAGQEPEIGLVGEFAVTIAPEDVPPELIGGPSLIGRWRVTFEADGAYVLGRQDVGELIRGEYAVEGNRLSLGAETGIIACESRPNGEAAAVYEWEVAEARLLLTALEEPCDWRRLLLTTRTLSSFVACPPLQAAPAAGGGDTPDEEPGRSSATPTGVAPLTQSAPTADIDALLKQMSDCWATRHPDRFLRLLSLDFRAVQAPEDEDERRRFILTMSAPIVWDLAGEVELVDATRVTAPVRQTLGDNVDVGRQRFVLEDGVWRWDGPDAGS